MMMRNLTFAFRHHPFRSTAGEGLREHLIRGGLGSAGIQAANLVLSLLLGIVLARTLGADGYGIYAYAFALMSLLMVAAEAGVPTLLMREVAASQGREDWGLLRGVLRRAIQFVALTSTTLSLLGLLMVWWWADSLTPAVLYTTILMLLVLPFSAVAKTVAHAMRGLHRVVIGQAVDMLVRPMIVLTLAGSVFLLWPEWQQPHVAMAAQLLAAIAVLILGLLILRRLTPPLARTARPVYRSRKWLRSALPFTLIGGAGIINSHTDIIMLGWLTDSEQVGIYRVAVQASALVALSLQVANSVIAPQFSRLHAQGDIVRLQLLVTQSARIVIISALPLALLFMLFGGLLASWVFGSEFLTAQVPIAILAGGQLLNAAFGSVGFLLNMTGHEAISARTLWLTALLNVALNTALIPLFGINGAAIATSASLVAWNVLLYRQVQRRLGIHSIAWRFRLT